MEISSASRREHPSAHPPGGDTAATAKIKLGTCAWNFEDWRDVFYPPALASNLEIAYYARGDPREAYRAIDGNRAEGAARFPSDD